MVNHPDTGWNIPHCNLTWRTAKACVETVMTHRNLLILSCSLSFYNFSRIFANIGGGGERGKKREKIKLFVKWHLKSMPLTASFWFPRQALSELLQALQRQFLLWKSSFLLSGSHIFNNSNHSQSWKCHLLSWCCWCLRKRQTKSAWLS